MMILDKIDLFDFKNLVREEIQCMINFTNNENSIQSATNFVNKHQKKKKNNKRKECFRYKEIIHFERSYFIDYQIFTVSQFIYDIDSNCLQTFDIESVIVFDDKKYKRTFKSVLHIFKLKHDLFSLTIIILMS